MNTRLLPEAPTVSCRVAPERIAKGGYATLSWSSTNATEVTITPGIGRVEDSGSLRVEPSETTVYIIKASGLGGTTDARAGVKVVPAAAPGAPAFRVMKSEPAAMPSIPSKPTLKPEDLFNQIFINVSPSHAPEEPRSPKILIQPEDKTICAGQSVTFAVKAEGTAPLKFEWRKNGEPVKTATEGFEHKGLVIEGESEYKSEARVSSDSDDLFDVVVSNSVGSLTSNSVTLTVNPAPSKSIFIVTQKMKKEVQVIEARRARDVSRLVKQGVERCYAKFIVGFYDRVRPDRSVRFQSFQFSNISGANPHADVREWNDGHGHEGLGKQDRKFGGKGTVHYQKGRVLGVDADGNPNDDSIPLLSGLSKGTGISNKAIKGNPASQGQRSDTPWWFCDNHCAHDFMNRLINRGGLKLDYRFTTGRHLQGAELRNALRDNLDYQMVYFYYFLRWEDPQIFERFDQAFKDEKGRQRVTSSPDAVKMRRRRLINAGYVLYGLMPPGTEYDEGEELCAPETEDDERLQNN